MDTSWMEMFEKKCNEEDSHKISNKFTFHQKQAEGKAHRVLGKQIERKS